MRGKSEEGYALLVTLLVMFLMATIGYISLDTTSTELDIVGNERIYKENFFQAESAAMECVQTLENSVDNAKTIPVEADGLSENGVHSLVKNATSWSSEAHNATLASSQWAAYTRGIHSGSSLDVSKSSVHVFSVFGKSDEQNGEVTVKLGYRKAY
jgi:Tfp pilus assembly protein PilX